MRYVGAGGAHGSSFHFDTTWIPFQMLSKEMSDRRLPEAGSAPRCAERWVSFSSSPSQKLLSGVAGRWRLCCKQPLRNRRSILTSFTNSEVYPYCRGGDDSVVTR